MSRDQRVQDNYALVSAQTFASENNQPLLVLFNIDESFPNFNSRNASFMFKNLVLVEKDLLKLSIPMIVTKGAIEKNIMRVIDEYEISVVITDFSPLNISRNWLRDISKDVTVPIIVVDTHNVVPCWIASSKQEYSARTIRPKIHKLLDDYFNPLPLIRKHEISLKASIEQTNWSKLYDGLKIDHSVEEVSFLKPGEREAHKILQQFIENKLDSYAELKTDPTENVLSNLSPYIHFGQLSAQKIAWEVMRAPTIPKKAKDVFIEELIVRRELADNYCFYNDKYDQVDGFHPWAQDSLSKHLMDKRDYIYSMEDFEKAKTHDELWNAAQLEMVLIGKMHGYMRMYWAKKILEWTETPSDAQKIAIQLNDKYELDGRDPNGYTGIAWSIGGVHDRPWGPERPIFGLVRYMNYAGAKRKFKVQKYIKNIAEIAEKR